MSRAAWDLRASFYDIVFKLPFFRGIRQGERASFRELIRGLKFENGRVLDIACGTGEYLDILENGRLYGVDYSEEMLRVAKGRNKACLVLADARFLPFRNSSFDLAVCIGLLEYFRDKEEVLTEVHRVLKKNGYGVISYSHRSLLNALRNLLGSKVYPCSGRELAISLNKFMLEWVKKRKSLLQGQVLCRKT